MLAAFCILCCMVSVAGYALLNRIAYALYRPLCKKINTHLYFVTPRHVFSIFSAYMKFRFAGDYTHISELPEQYLLLSNHQSLLDIVVYVRYIDGGRLRFVAKKALSYGIPLVSVILKSDQHCLVQRTGSPSQAMNAVDLFAKRVIKNNWIPVLFPEGTRSKTGALGTFHSAGFRRLISKAPMPVAVAAVDGGWAISSMRQIRKNLKNGAYRVKILKVYPTPTTKEEQLKILQEGKELIQQQLDIWRSNPQA